MKTLNAIPGSNPTAFFNADGTTLSGSTGCNEYTGAYKTEQGNKLTISGFSSTLAACASDALTTQEATFLAPDARRRQLRGQRHAAADRHRGRRHDELHLHPTRSAVGPTAVIISGDLADTGQQMTFDGSQSTAGSLPIARFNWDMGDGTTLNGAIVKYTYNNPGSYTVTLTVTDQGGQQNTTTKTVQINPVVEVVPPTAVIEGPSSAFVGDSVTFSAAGSQQGTAPIANYQWQSGDGSDTGLVAGQQFYNCLLAAGHVLPERDGGRRRRPERQRQYGHHDQCRLARHRLDPEQQHSRYVNLAAVWQRITVRLRRL